MLHSPSLLAATALALVLLVVGEGDVLLNETVFDNVTTTIYQNDVTMPPQVAINTTLLSVVYVNATEHFKEVPHKLPHNYSSNTTLQINETFLLDGTSEANRTLEDNESFQDTEDHLQSHCPEAYYEHYNRLYCGIVFENSMATIPKENWCDWDEIKHPYNALSVCMENLADLLQCFYPNQQTQGLFVAIHETYFQACQEEEEVPWDAPPSLVLALTLLPVSLIPVLVFMVVWKNSARE